MECEISLAVGGFAVISRRSSRRWTLVRGGSSNAESAVNPTGARRPEDFRYHPNSMLACVLTQIKIRISINTRPEPPCAFSIG